MILSGSAITGSSVTASSDKSGATRSASAWAVSSASAANSALSEPNPVRRPRSTMPSAVKTPKDCPAAVRKETSFMLHPICFDVILCPGLPHQIQLRIEDPQDGGKVMPAPEHPTIGAQHPVLPLSPGQ